MKFSLSLIFLVAAASATGCATKGDFWKEANFESKADCKTIAFSAAQRASNFRGYDFNAKPSCKRTKDGTYIGRFRTDRNMGGPDAWLTSTPSFTETLTPIEMDRFLRFDNNYQEPVDAQPQIERKIP